MKTKKIIRNVVIVVAISAIVVMLLIAKDLPLIWENLMNVDIPYLLLAIGITFLYFLTWGYSLQILIRHKSKSIKSVDNFLVAGTEFFFNGITPFSSGGQPLQLYSYSRCEVDNSDATSALMMNFIVHQVITNVISLVTLILYYSRVVDAVEGFMIVVLIGFAINIFVLTFLMLISLSPKALTALNHFLNFLCKFRVFSKFISPRRETLNNYVIRFQKTFLEMLKNGVLLLKIVLVRLISLLVLYSIPFFILIALGAAVTVEDLFFVIALGSFTYTFTAYIPSPGASGGAEFGFKTLLMALACVAAAPSLALSTMLIWRFLTYYMALVYGFILYMIFERRTKV